MTQLTRRSVLTGTSASLLTVALGSCQTHQASIGELRHVAVTHHPSVSPQSDAPAEVTVAVRRQVAPPDYGPVIGEPFPVRAAPLSRINPVFLRTRVEYARAERPGTIVIDPRSRYLYLVEERASATRYGVGVGREGFAWAGTATIQEKQEWPDWYPPKEMIQRQPDLRSKLSELQSGLGVPGGPHNPLGARALYLWQNNKDTLYRIHGTNEPWTIGTSVSSGCIRMINQDVIDLYDRTAVGAKVVVLSGGAARVG